MRSCQNRRDPVSNIFCFTSVCKRFKKLIKKRCLCILIDERGFIHNLSPVKKSKSGKTNWFEFTLQTSPVKTKRVVGYNTSSHNELKELEHSKSPVVLINTKEDKSGDVIFNQMSTARSASTSDVGFDYDVLQQSAEASSSLSICLTITLGEVSSIRPNQKVIVVGALSLGDEPAKQVKMRGKEVAMVKDDCILEDVTGSAPLHIWDTFINSVENGKSYRFENLVVKSFQGAMYLSTTFTTSVTMVEAVVESLVGPQMLESKQRAVTVEEFKMVRKLDIFLACQSCSKKIEDVCGDFVKCKYCDVRQRRLSCETCASAQVKVELPEDEAEGLWLTVFTEVLEQLLKPSFEISLSSSDSIEEALLRIKNVKFVYNIISNVITKVWCSL